MALVHSRPFDGRVFDESPWYRPFACLTAGLRELAWLAGARSDVPEVLRMLDCFVLPSLTEVTSCTLQEAMACGLPIVATAVGGNPEVVADGLTGRIVPLEQAQDGTGTPLDPDKFVADLARILTEVVSDPALARLMGRAGRMRAESEFSWTRIADRTLQVYGSLRR